MIDIDINILGNLAQDMYINILFLKILTGAFHFLPDHHPHFDLILINHPDPGVGLNTWCWSFPVFASSSLPPPQPTAPP